MDNKERRVLHGTYKGDKDWIEHLRYRLKYLIEKEVEFLREDFVASYRRDLLRSPDGVMDYFVRIASQKDLSNCPLTLEQMVHIAVVDYFLVRANTLSGRFHWKSGGSEQAALLRAENFATMPSEFTTVEGFRDLLILNAERELTPDIASIPCNRTRFVDRLERIASRSVNSRGMLVLCYLSQQR